jgi:hypothetical protein
MRLQNHLYFRQVGFKDEAFSTWIHPGAEQSL